MLIISKNRIIVKSYHFHSYLNASTGFNLLALMAGTTPLIAPVTTANAINPRNKDIVNFGARNPHPRLFNINPPI